MYYAVQTHPDDDLGPVPRTLHRYVPVNTHAVSLNRTLCGEDIGNCTSFPRASDQFCVDCDAEAGLRHGGTVQHPRRRTF